MVIKRREKKGWIKIVEAFVSILLVVGVLLIVINKGYIGRDVSLEIYEAELSILRGIQVDDSLRNDILVSNKSGYDSSVDESPLPIDWEYFDNNEQRMLQGVKDKINEQVPDYLECKAKICELSDVCLLDEITENEIYTQHATITANYAVFSPRQLKLFCWIK